MKDSLLQRVYVGYSCLALQLRTARGEFGRIGEMPETSPETPSYRLARVKVHFPLGLTQAKPRV